MFFSLCCQHNPDWYTALFIWYLRACSMEGTISKTSPFEQRFVFWLHSRFQSYLPEHVSTTYCLEHVYMRPEVNSNRFEISLQDKISLWCGDNFIISVHMISIGVKLTSVQISLQSNWPKRNFKPQWVFHVKIKCPQSNKVAQNH